MFYLVLDADLSENIRRIFPEDAESSPAEYTFDIACTFCGEKQDSAVVINRFEKFQLSGSKGKASLVMKCGFCDKEFSIDLNEFEDSLYNNEELAEKVLVQRKKRNLNGIQGKCVLLALDCRGCEVICFYPDNLKFFAELSTGKIMKFQLEDGELYDYDDDSGQEVTVTEVISDIVKGK